MSKIKEPFAESAYSKMMRSMTEYELAYKKYNDLLILKDRISKGQMSRDLYDFINADGSLEEMFINLPPPEDGVACESLRSEQLRLLDQIIATEEFKHKEALKKIWEAIAEWWMDWWDRVRKLRFLAIDLQTKFEVQTSTYFGDAITYASSNVLMYHHDNWVRMFTAARDIVNATRNMPTSLDQIKVWIESSKSNISRNLSEFGFYLNENGSLCRGTVKHIRQENTCATLGWKFGNVHSELADVISLLGDEIQARRDFNKLKSAFNADNGVISNRELLYVRDIIFTSRQTAYAVGRTYCVMLNQIIRQHASSYRLNKMHQ